MAEDLADDSGRVVAPWSAEQVESLNAYQRSGRGHPFTCGNGKCHGPDDLGERPALVARKDGWYCRHCDWIQNWAWVFMADGRWLMPGPWSLMVFQGAHGDIDPPRPIEEVLAEVAEEAERAKDFFPVRRYRSKRPPRPRGAAGQ